MSGTKLNRSFVQLADPDGINAMIALSKANTKAAALFYFMMKYIDKDNCLIVSMDTLGAKMDCSPRTASRAVRYLREHRYIAVFKSGSMNVYTLNSDIIWKDYGDKRTDALLQGAVLLGLEEQDADVQTRVKRSMNQLELVK